MKLEELGIDPKTMRHKKVPLTHEENAFIGILWIDHVGADNKISADDLAFEWGMKVRGPGGGVEEWKREVRHLQNHFLIDHNLPILSQAGIGGGYWIAENEQEAAEFYDSFRKRGLTGLVKATRGKQSAMIDMVTQLSFRWEELVDKVQGAHPSIPQGERVGTAPVEVVDEFLSRMSRDPERFAEDLKKLGEKYGSVLLPKKRYEEMVAAISNKAAELQQLAQELRQ